jgi:hypothetical protein
MSTRDIAQGEGSQQREENCHYPGLLDPLPLPTSAWTDISLDFFEGLPKSWGKEVILLVVH